MDRGMSQKTQKNKTSKDYYRRKYYAQRRQKEKRRQALLAGLLVLLLCALVWFVLKRNPGWFQSGAQGTGSDSAAGNSSFSVHYLDVGQADATLILCGDSALLIDGGNQEDAPLVLEYLRQQGVDHLDYILCTHAHEDHCGGLAQIVRQTADAGTQVLAPQEDADNWFFHDFASAAEAQGCAVRVPSFGETFAVGEAAAQIVGPVRPAQEILQDENGLVNNTSLMVRVEYEGCAFLFCGDAQWQEEQEVVEAAGKNTGAAQSTGTAQNAGTAEEAGTAELPGVVLTSNVLKPGHHGSANATSYSFLMEVNPTYAVISCGTGNEYGHPHEDTLEKLAEAGVNLYRTDLQGTIVCTVRGGKPDFAPQHDPQAAVWIAPPLPEQIPEE